MLLRRSLGLIVASSLLAIACGKRDPEPPPASWQPDRSCVASADCAPAPSCCPAPCTGDVINVKDLSRAQARVDAHCTKEARAQCPQAGGCQTHVYACVRSQCALVTQGSPDWPN